jgi:hypothetical protein
MSTISNIKYRNVNLIYKSTYEYIGKKKGKEEFA